MIIEEIKSIKSGKRELRKFGITIAALLALMGSFFWWRDKDWYLSTITVSIVFLFFGLLVPNLLYPIYKAWMTLAVFIGWFVTRAILVILFYLVVTPIALLACLWGKDFLNIKLDRNVNSYWISRKAIKFDKRSYENQF